MVVSRRLEREEARSSRQEWPRNSRDQVKSQYSIFFHDVPPNNPKSTCHSLAPNFAPARRLCVALLTRRRRLLVRCRGILLYLCTGPPSSRISNLTLKEATRRAETCFQVAVQSFCSGETRLKSCRLCRSGTYPAPALSPEEGSRRVKRGLCREIELHLVLGLTRGQIRGVFVRERCTTR